jgi:hypothetical protein
MGGTRVNPAISSNDPRSVSSRSTVMAGPLQAVTPAVRRLSSPPVMHLKTSPIGFAIWWLVLLVLHAVNVAYYIGAAVLYHAMRLTNTSFQLETYSIGVPRYHYYTVSKIHWIVAALHGVFMLAMVIGSLQARRLVFLPLWLTRVWTQFPSITIKTTVSIPPNQPSCSMKGTLMSLARRLSSFSNQSMMVTKSIFGREGLLGVDGVYFDHLLLARELVETSLQIIQVYRMSYLLPSVWLIRFYVTLLIANCWSSPVLHGYYGNHHVDRRVTSLLCDAVLDTVSSIGISFWIFATYAPQYTDPMFGFPFTQWFDDVWFTNMQQEFQMMMVMSWADMASRLVFTVGLLQCMEPIKKMLTPPAETQKLSAISGAVMKTNAEKKDEAARDLHKTTGPTKPEVDFAKPKKGNSSRCARIFNVLLEQVAPAFFIVLGFAILVIHIVSETRQLSSQVPCHLQLHPWFVSKPACSLVELDCHQLGGLSGSHESMDKAWNTYEFGATTRLLVRHCPQREVPTTLQQFRQLAGLKFYNSTIAVWAVEAAFTAVLHENMRAISAIRTNFSNGELPPGLLTTEFAQGLRSFTTSTTNIH